MNIAVFCSGNGSNLQAIINAIKAGKVKAKIGLVICDNNRAYCLKRAKRANLKTVFIDPSVYKTRQTFDKEAIKQLKEYNIELIVLAGFMRILSNYFVKKYRNRILNVHPALLPAFKGANSIKDAYKYGVKVAGVTIHFVNEKLDSGPIILQDVIKIRPRETLKSFELKIHKLEHILYPKAIDLFARGKLKIQGSIVKILILVIFLLIMTISLLTIASAEDTFICRDYSSLPPELSLNRTYNGPENPEKEWDDFFVERPNLEEEAWRPLTNDEYTQRERVLAYTSAKAAAEFFDSIYMPYISTGLFSIIGTAYQIDAYQQNLKDKHGFSFDVDIDDLEVNVKYERMY